MAQINGYKEELQDELQKTDPNSHASRLLAQGKRSQKNFITQCTDRPFCACDRRAVSVRHVCDIVIK